MSVPGDKLTRIAGVSDRHCRQPISLRTVELVDRKAEIREFLISRRAKVSPEQAGIPSYGELRRVPGLRREEVAQLAGVSADYYTRLERGSIRGVSDSVLEAVASRLSSAWRAGRNPWPPRSHRSASAP